MKLYQRRIISPALVFASMCEAILQPERRLRHPLVSLNEPDRQTGQYSLNHEAGHFLYWAANSTAYALYRRQLRAKEIPYEGGHRDDDLSGKKAKEYGLVKDKKSN